MYSYNKIRPLEFGIFKPNNCVDGCVGIDNIASRIGLFLYDNVNQQCLVMNIDHNLNLFTVVYQVNKYLENQNIGLDSCSALLVGGYGHENYGGANDLSIKIFNWLTHFGCAGVICQPHDVKDAAREITSIDGKCYAGFVFNLFLRIYYVTDMRQVFGIPFNNRQSNLYNLCFDNLKYRKCLSETVLEISQKQPIWNISAITLAYIGVIQKTNDSQYLIPINNFIQAYDLELGNLRSSITQANVLQTIFSLFTNFTPAHQICEGQNQRRPLHFAAIKLNDDPENFFLLVQFFLVLFFARRDFLDLNNRFALNYLTDNSLRDVKEAAYSFLLLASRIGNNEEIMNNLTQWIYTISLQVIEDIHQCGYYPNKIESCRQGFIDMLDGRFDLSVWLPSQENNLRLNF